MLSGKKQNYVFYALLTIFTLFASLAHLHLTFQILIGLIVILSPIIFDDTKTISVYFFSVCFMACFGDGGFLTALNISLLLLEIKKICIAIKTKQDLQNIKKILIVWFSLLIVLTIYSLIFNHFKIYRMAMFLDFIQCILVCYLVRKNINIKHVLFTLFAGLVSSISIAFIFNLTSTKNAFVAGHIDGRFGGFFNNVNGFSVYCSLCAASFIVLMLNNKLSFNRYFYLPVIVSALGCLTYSKAFILVNVLLYILWFILSFAKSNDKKKFMLFSILLVGVILLIAFLSRTYIKTILDRFISDKDPSNMDHFTTGRTKIWNDYIDRWLKSPLTFLFGNGYTASKIPCGRYEHSIYIAFLYQFGVIGTILIISTLIWTLRTNAKLQKNIACYIPLALFMFNGLVSNLSGVLCSCLLWFMVFYFVTFDINQTVENKTSKQLELTNTEENTLTSTTDTNLDSNQ